MLSDMSQVYKIKNSTIAKVFRQRADKPTVRKDKKNPEISSGVDVFYRK